MLQGTSKSVFWSLFGTKTIWRWKFEFDNFSVLFFKNSRGSPGYVSVFDVCQWLVYIESDEETRKQGLNSHKQDVWIPWISICNFGQSYGILSIFEFCMNVDMLALLYTKIGAPPCIKTSLNHIICNNLDLFDF